MLTWTRSSLTAAALAALLAGPALAQPDAAAGTSLTAEQVTAKLQAAGYTNVHDVEYDDGQWEADAVSADGRSVDLEIDPRTGAVTHESAD